MYIAIIGAMDSEIKNIKSLMNIEEVRKISNIDYYIGSLRNKRVILASCYEGKVNASICIQTLILNFDIDLVINIGVAGSLVKEVKLLDLVVATSVVQHDYDLSPLGYDKGYVLGVNKINIECDNNYTNKLIEVSNKNNITKSGTVLSGDVFVTDNDKISKLSKEFNAIAVDMESAAIGQVCYINNKKFVILRAISDSGSNIEFREFLDRAVIKLTDVIINFVSEV
jgi:adenosylhomocysteine nucleosidase